MNAIAFAVLWTVVSLALGALLEVNGVPALGPLVLLCAAWASRDAENLEVARYEGWMACSSVQVGIRVALFWLLAFPAYLYLRQRIVLGEARLAGSLSLGGGAPPPPRPTARARHPERARSLNRVATAGAALALLGVVSSLLWAQLDPGSYVGADIFTVSALPAGLGVALTLLSLRDGGEGWRLAASALTIAVALWSGLAWASEFASQPTREWIFRGQPLPPADLFPERLVDLQRAMVNSYGFSPRGCPIYSAFYRPASGRAVELRAELCPASAAVGEYFEALAQAEKGLSGFEALRSRRPDRLEFATQVCAEGVCLEIWRRVGNHIFRIEGRELSALRLERELWRTEEQPRP